MEIVALGLRRVLASQDRCVVMEAAPETNPVKTQKVIPSLMDVKETIHICQFEMVEMKLLIHPSVR